MSCGWVVDVDEYCEAGSDVTRRSASQLSPKEHIVSQDITWQITFESCSVGSID